MKNKHYAHRRGSGYFKSSHRKSKKGGFEWSESDLIRTVEYSQKAFYQEEPEYVTQNSFDNFDLMAPIKQNIKAKGFTSPTPIQDQVIPQILQGHDLIGIANTGTGKTAAFLIPLINKAAKSNTQKVLIVAPTRELAEQIYSDFIGLSRNTFINSALLIGGAGMSKQISDLKRNPGFVIGTPGRIKDMVERKILNLGTYNNVVLDEADRMVDIGFIDEIKLFISMLPQQRQSLFFSATVSPKVQGIINNFVRNPVTVNVKKRETANSISQEIVRVNGNKTKVDALHELLRQNAFKKVIVFGNTKWSVQKLSDEFAHRGVKADAIHGDKRQNQRHNILERFKRSEINVLFATDVAARGLDIRDVTHVINYEMPKSYDDYVHRIGRTGRAEKKGIALTFVGY